ncbi:hypothetical protein A8C32_01860 [Flavivirga aquatica]|uniref:Carboxyltransferase domain-containing protein n=1 Tax=Flavivirga aquatica TaxID=1849968 RepID=A0A1E5TA50_9FLAO|nr:5-oxoprolinase subunit PxpB [Flavivirga aquatica]OEK08231.1 hypothetical protein A8C32_01860 [Flavivirga aquatica]
MGFDVIYKRYAESSILIEWPDLINVSILDDILLFKEKILKHGLNQGIEIIQAYNALLVNYEEAHFNFENKLSELKKIYISKTRISREPPRLWKIPVCYDDQFGIDLEVISQQKKISKEDIITYHHSSLYTVYFIGFLPGFLYLGGLNEKLFIPRRSTPRLQIEKGAVAIGGNQTGVYPKESPGGWHIIGNSPINFFNIDSETPCFARARDRIQFQPVSLKAYYDVKVLVEAGVYQLESEVIDD